MNISGFFKKRINQIAAPAIFLSSLFYASSANAGHTVQVVRHGKIDEVTNIHFSNNSFEIESQGNRRVYEQNVGTVLVNYGDIIREEKERDLKDNEMLLVKRSKGHVEEKIINFNNLPDIGDIGYAPNHATIVYDGETKAIPNNPSVPEGKVLVNRIGLEPVFEPSENRAISQLKNYSSEMPTKYREESTPLEQLTLNSNDLVRNSFEIIPYNPAFFAATSLITLGRLIKSRRKEDEEILILPDENDLESYIKLYQQENIKSPISTYTDKYGRLRYRNTATGRFVSKETARELISSDLEKIAA